MGCAYSRRGLNALAFAIVEQAVEDYKFLLGKEIDRWFFDDINLEISKKELEKFFQSELCDALLSSNKIGVDGRSILRLLKAMERERSSEVVA